MADVPESLEAALEERGAVEAQIFACHQRIAFLNGYIATVNDGQIDQPVPKPNRAQRRAKPK